jgi:hypothetical protein
LRRVPPPLAHLVDPPEPEGALVPRRPRRPLGSDSVALELPDEPDDVDARGRQA